MEILLLLSDQKGPMRALPRVARIARFLRIGWRIKKLDQTVFVGRLMQQNA
jgi:hypothetical protein